MDSVRETDRETETEWERVKENSIHWKKHAPTRSPIYIYIYILEFDFCYLFQYQYFGEYIIHNINFDYQQKKKKNSCYFFKFLAGSDNTIQSNFYLTLFRFLWPCFELFLVIRAKFMFQCPNVNKSIPSNFADRLGNEHLNTIRVTKVFVYLSMRMCACICIHKWVYECVCARACGWLNVILLAGTRFLDTLVV